MKALVRNFLDKFFGWVMFWSWVILVLWVYSAYSAYVSILSVNTWDKLTSSTFNNLISNIEDINSRVSSISSIWTKTWNNIYYNSWNVWVGNNNPQANLDVSWTVKMFWNRTAISVWTTYQAPSDWFVLAFWRTDWNSWLIRLSLLAWNPPVNSLWEAYSYNNWVTRLWSFQLMIPIKKWEYYKLVCEWSDSCPATYFLWWFMAYFIPLWN